MKRIAIIAAALSMCACATHTIPNAAGHPVTISGVDASYLDGLKDPAVQRTFDNKGPVPQLFLDMVQPECEGNMAFTYFPHRVYWMLRGTPSLLGASDKELAYEYISTCRALHEVGKSN